MAAPKLATDLELPTEAEQNEEGNSGALVQSNTDVREDHYNPMAKAPTGTLKNNVGNPIEHCGDYIPIVGSAGDTDSTAPRYGYEIALQAGARNSRRLAGDTAAKFRQGK